MRARWSKKDAKALTCHGTPAEQVATRPRSCTPLVEHCAALQAQDLAYELGADAGMSEWRVDTAVTGRTISQQFRLESRPMPWGGGVKYYFHCDCGRRCAKLYLPPGGSQFACRSCHRLLYWDQRYKPRKGRGGQA